MALSSLSASNPLEMRNHELTGRMPNRSKLGEPQDDLDSLNRLAAQFSWQSRPRRLPFSRFTAASALLGFQTTNQPASPVLPEARRTSNDPWRSLPRLPQLRALLHQPPFSQSESVPMPLGFWINCRDQVFATVSRFGESQRTLVPLAPPSFQAPRCALAAALSHDSDSAWLFTTPANRKNYCLLEFTEPRATANLLPSPRYATFIDLAAFARLGTCRPFRRWLKSAQGCCQIRMHLYAAQRIASSIFLKIYLPCFQ
jgi:hypothetical protein